MLQRYSTCPLFDQLPGYAAIKDLDARYVRANNKLSTLTGFAHQHDMIGLLDSDLKCQAAESANTYRKEDLDVIARDEAIQLMCFDNYANNDARLLHTVKSPLRDENGEICGIMNQAQELTLDGMSRILLRMNDSLLNGRPVTFEIRENYHGINLSRRECECLFYLLRGFSATDISNTLNLSKRTIESYIENIKSKLKCDSKKQIFEKAHQLGFIHTLPISILQQLSKLGS